ncbi:MAG: VTT domain-containing protein [Planctomycetota bacterium]
MTTPSRPDAERSVPTTSAIGALALFLLLAPAFGAVALVVSYETWLPPLEELGAAACLPFAAITVVLVGLGLTPTHAHSLVAGWLFGIVGGTLLALACVTLAAALAHRVFGGWSREWAFAALTVRPRAAAVHRALVECGTWRSIGLVALVRLSPFMPYAGTNLLMASANVRPLPFVAGSGLGLAPRVAALAVAGAGLAELDLSQAADARLALLGGVATLLLLFVLGRITAPSLRSRAG